MYGSRVSECLNIYSMPQHMNDWMWSEIPTCFCFLLCGFCNLFNLRAENEQDQESSCLEGTVFCLLTFLSHLN